MPITITVEGKVVGRKTPMFSDWSVELPPAGMRPGGRMTLAQLIERIVRSEVQAFNERQEQRRLPRLLARDEIEQAVLGGRVDLGGREVKQQADSESAVATALLAYQDGLYYVFVDGAQQTELQQEVWLRPDSRVTFLRLVALAGG
jgi:hypothetical protein